MRKGLWYLFAAFLVAAGGCAAEHSEITPPAPHSPPPHRQRPRPALPAPTFAEVYQQVLEPKCVRCHSLTKPFDGVDVSSAEAILNHPTLINFNYPEQSLLLFSVLGGRRADMPPRGYDIPPLTEEEIDLLLRWIREFAE